MMSREIYLSKDYKKVRCRKYSAMVFKRAEELSSSDESGLKKKYSLTYPSLQNWFANRNRNTYYEDAFVEIMSKFDPNADGSDLWS